MLTAAVGRKWKLAKCAREQREMARVGRLVGGNSVDFAVENGDSRSSEEELKAPVKADLRSKSKSVRPGVEG
jgi:hypothetical protein